MCQEFKLLFSSDEKEKKNPIRRRKKKVAFLIARSRADFLHTHPPKGCLYPNWHLHQMDKAEKELTGSAQLFVRQADF